MYTHRMAPFGQYTQHVIEDAAGRARMRVVPEGCAALLELTLAGRSLLDAYETPEALNNNAWYKNVPLFPFANRLRDGAYNWNGHNRRFFLNDGVNGNALHGFSREFSAAAHRVDMRALSGAIVCRFDYEGEEEAFPFPFSADFEYRLENGDRFTAFFRFRNQGRQSMPLSFGWHPYLLIDHRGIDELSLELPPCRMVGVDRRMLPTGKLYDYDELSTPRRLAGMVLDNCFALHNDGPGKAITRLWSAGAALECWQETGPGKLNYLQIFTHPDRDSIAIEPVSGNIDAFNNGEGLIVLEPGQEAAASFGVVASPIQS
jgi:aldose 1-epimerase